jgi:tetratricopeptide (TPR) repeat protein
MAGDYAMAEIEYTKTIDVMPDYARCHMQLGKLCLRTGRIGQALAHWKKALEVSPDNDQARELIEKYSK